MLHARHLRDVLRTAPDGARSIAEEFDRRTEAHVTPWYHAQMAVDHARFAEMNAAREGRSAPPPGPGLGVDLDLGALEQWRVG